ncbi:hypothetical protein [Streptomyces purpurascens]|uniref:hypothetical protein n=1 Tax=Streptomyces purpurascens TaxID=1924 RepID=UPI00167B5E0D|nr:hypothetical protein [Streptomyces purpurascens]MCE7045520.1 hypothetical protein [Streptomyces purpurascens]
MSGGERERTPVDRVRRLSDTEATFAYTHALMGGRGGLTTSFTMNGVFSPERVEAAVELWLRRLPLLSLRIEDTGGGELWFRQGTPGPSAGERLWGLRVGRAAEGATRFSLSLHPAICDGHSVGRLVRPLLDALFGVPGTCAGKEDLPPDTDELTYESGGVCGVCVPGPARRAVTSYGAGAGPGHGRGRSAGVVRESGGGVTLAIGPYETRRLRDWCGARRLTVSGFLATVLADAFARESGRREVTVATAVSLRRRYAERALISEPGCVLGVVRARLRAGGAGRDAVDAGGDLVGRARGHAEVLCSAGRDWRPERRAHTAIRRAVERETEGGGPELRVTDAGSVDTALGPHAGRVTGFRTMAARGDGALDGTLHLSSFKGALTVGLAVGGAWAAVAERELSDAMLLHNRR